jgi:hypothetical protein
MSEERGPQVFRYPLSVYHPGKCLSGHLRIMSDSLNFEVFKVVIYIVILWAVTPYGLVSGYQCLRGTYCLHLY